jgi:hypothetical protein
MDYLLELHDELHVQPIKLLDGDNYYDLNLTMQELAFAWLRVHPTIASSYQAWERGEFPADTQFYVVNDDIENAIVYKKKQLSTRLLLSLIVCHLRRRRKLQDF